MPRVLDRSKILPEVRRNSLDLRSPPDVRVGILRFYMDTSRFAVWIRANRPVGFVRIERETAPVR